MNKKQRIKSLMSEKRKHDREIEKLNEELPPNYEQIVEEIDWRMSRLEDIYFEIKELKS